MFFTYFLPHKEEALGIKERCPIDYMACIEEHFYRAMGLHLNGLRGFTAWIKQGSYYHRLVAQKAASMSVHTWRGSRCLGGPR